MKRHIAVLGCVLALVQPVQAQLPRGITPEAYAAELLEVVARSPRLPLEASPIAIVPPSPDWGIGMVSWLTTDRAGLIYLLQRGDQADPVIVLDRQGRVVRSWGKGMYLTPHSIRIDPAGNVWTTDAKSSLVIKFAPDGTKLMEISIGGLPPGCDGAFCGTTDIAFGPDGRLFIADGYRNARILEYTSDGRKVREWGRPGVGPGEFQLPHSIVIDEGGVVYVADRQNGRVQRFDLEGKYLGEWPSYGKTFSLDLAPGAIWLASQHLHEPNMSPGWLIKVDRQTGRVLGYVNAHGGHGVRATPNGEVLYGPGPEQKPQIFRPAR